MKKKDNIENRYQDFFDLYSKSLLIALYSMVENKLKEICDITYVDFCQILKYEHLDSRDYLSTSFNYFDLVIRLQTESLHSYKSKLKDIQFIRNRVVHTESKFSDENEEVINQIVNKSKGALGLHKDKSITTLRIQQAKFIKGFF